MRIRDSTEWDLPEIHRVCVEAHAQFEDVLTPENWPKLKSGISRVGDLREDGTLIVGEIEGELVGVVAYFPPGRSNPRIFDPSWASIRMLSVSPHHRRKGIARTLSEECVRRAHTAGASTIALHTGEQMIAARRLYESMGFEILREIESRFGYRYWIYIRDFHCLS